MQYLLVFWRNCFTFWQWKSICTANNLNQDFFSLKIIILAQRLFLIPFMPRGCVCAYLNVCLHKYFWSFAIQFICCQWNKNIQFKIAIWEESLQQCAFEKSKKGFVCFIVEIFSIIIWSRVTFWFWKLERLQISFEWILVYMEGNI